MGRVHGSRTIHRRENHELKHHYREYASILIEDFHGLCGYCGQDLQISGSERQTDHFIPKKFCEACGHPEYIHSYENLVNSCRVCNRNKWDDWPTQSLENPNNGKVGYVDPACSEFDKHLTRTEEGKILPISKVGKYMYKRLQFSIRPIEIFWLIQSLESQLDMLDERIQEIGPESNLLEKYYKCSTNLRKYTRIIRSAKEAK